VGEWHDFSQQEPHPASVRTVSFRIGVPRLILLIIYDHLPKKEVKFTRHPQRSSLPRALAF
jgi:hypothetical protein